MKSFSLSLVAVLLSISLADRAQAQTPESAQVSVSAEGRVAESMSGLHIPSVQGLPFFAKVELETVSQLQDGTQISHRTYNMDARDSAGRTRNEVRNWIGPDGGEPRLTRIELYDPATHTRTDLFPLTRLARESVLNPAGQTATAAPASPKPETTREEIGTDTMEGLPVKGVRVTQTYATGALGNDRPLNVVTETWYAAELRINLLAKRTDPRYGVQTVRVTELDRQEPDAALFEIGREYKVVNEASPVPGAPSFGTAAEGATTSVGGGTNAALAGIARPGVNGVSVPACVYCPAPSFTEEARAAKVSGIVVLQVVITPEGQAENVSVLRKAGYGLDERAIEVVKTWRFKPATGADGKLVATLVPIEVTFRIK